jgi:hypothetical protein
MVAAGCADQFRRGTAIERHSGADRCTPPAELRREQQIDSHPAVKRLRGARTWVAADGGSNGEVGAGSRLMLLGRAFRAGESGLRNSGEQARDGQGGND